MGRELQAVQQHIAELEQWMLKVEQKQIEGKALTSEILNISTNQEKIRDLKRVELRLLDDEERYERQLGATQKVAEEQAALLRRQVEAQIESSNAQLEVAKEAADAQVAATNEAAARQVVAQQEAISRQIADSRAALNERLDVDERVFWFRRFFTTLGIAHAAGFVGLAAAVGQSDDPKILAPHLVVALQYFAFGMVTAGLIPLTLAWSASGEDRPKAHHKKLATYTAAVLALIAAATFVAALMEVAGVFHGLAVGVS